MRVLYLGADLYHKGGIPRYCRAQVKALRASPLVDRVEALSLHPSGRDCFEGPFAVDAFFSGAGPVSKVRYAAHALRIAARMRPDLIVSSHVHFGPMARWVARAAGARVVQNVYGLEVWSGLSRSRRRALARADTVISDCHFTGGWIQKHLGVSGRRVHVIWDCVELSRFHPGRGAPAVARRYGIPAQSGAATVMTLGRLDRAAFHKGYGRFLDCLREVGRRDPVRGVIAGGGPALDELRSMAADKGVAGQVHFTGSVAEQDLPAVYRLADVFALVSDRGKGRGEGIPLTPLEAAASGVPIIVGDEDGSQEAVEEGVNGFVVSPRDPAAFAERLTRLVRDAGLRERMGREARRRMEAHHGFEGFMEKTCDVCRATLGAA